MFCKKGVLRNFVKLTGKHLCQSLFFNKVAGLRPATLLKKRLWRKCFPVNFARFVRKPFIIEHLWRLLRNLFVDYQITISQIWKQVFNMQTPAASVKNENFMRTYHGKVSSRIISFLLWVLSLNNLLHQGLQAMGCCDDGSLL